MLTRSSSAALLALLLLFAGGGCGGAASSGDGGASDSTASTAANAAADPSLVSVSKFDLDDYDEQVVLLNFWATWCAPCRAEMPDLVDLQDELRSDGLQIIGVAMDQTGQKAVVPYLKRQPVNYPIVIDSTGKIGERYGGIPALPTTLLIGADGEVRERIVGRIRPQQLRERLDGLLAGSSPRSSSTPSSMPDSASTAAKTPPEEQFIKAGAP